MGMRTVTRWKPAALGVTALLALAMLSGCVPAATHTSTPTPEATPLFATDDEALAAATKAYAAYLKMSDTIAHDGGAHPERLNKYVSLDLAATDERGFADFRTNRWKSIGTTTFDNQKLQQYDPAALAGSATISVYLCVDVSNVNVIDSSGKSMVSPKRPDRGPVLATFALDPSSRALIVESSDPWKDASICG
jgi:hypothetical protein